ncbi:MAG: hypothetical protein QOJ50_65 [Cryptosporangiaceae bacterium]|nr:hypothetical protein [Cryptosporangiaceae bacterium]
MDVWPMIRAERESLAGALTDLPPGDWNRPSLAAGWTVRDVVAHIVATARTTPPKFVAGLVTSGFSFGTFVEKRIRETAAGRTDRELAGDLFACAGSRTAPPGPTASWLGETIVHGEDVFRALGGYRDHPVHHVIAVADFYKTSNLLIGSKRRIEGLRLRATDADWSHGTGPEVAGPAIALLLAMTGRKTALEDLTGEGVAELRARD